MVTRPPERTARDPMPQSRLYFGGSFQFSAGMKINTDGHSTRSPCPEIFPVQNARRCSHLVRKGDVEIICPVPKMRISQVVDKSWDSDIMWANRTK